MASGRCLYQRGPVAAVTSTEEMSSDHSVKCRVENDFPRKVEASSQRAPEAKMPGPKDHPGIPSKGSAMPINQRYLTELSDLFIEDLRQSEYYQNLPIAERTQLEARIEQEAAAGARPLLPGATPTELAALAQAVRSRLGVDLPLSLQNILQQVDGFVENGVTLFGVDPDFREDGFDSGPSLLGENEALWAGLPEATGRYLFVGDADLWFFAFDLHASCYVVLERHSLRPAHHFADAEEMLNDMLGQSLADCGEEFNDHTTASDISRN
jgi:hypothetical protein